MKKLLALSMIFLLAALAGCAGADAGGHETTAKAGTGGAACYGPRVFDSLGSFCEYQEGAKAGVEFCVAPERPLDSAALTMVTSSDGVYVTLHYSVPGDFADGFKSAYDKEQAAAAEYCLYLTKNPKALLGQLADSAGYKPREIDGVEYYCYTQLSAETGAAVLYSVMFISEAGLNLVNIPAIDGLEEMIPFVQTRQIDCSDKEAVGQIDNSGQ